MSNLNVFGKPLEICCLKPLTGYFRDGSCKTITEDTGTHTVCAIVSKEFLEFSASKGNDLKTPNPYWGFPGLIPGDKWCLCVSRWLEAENEGKAPKIFLGSTNQKTLNYVSLELLKKYSI
jgi:uncharacterized protein (DUF2237 family)